MSENSNITLEQARNEIQAKLNDENDRHESALRMENLYHDRRTTELNSLINKFTDRIKE